MKPGKNASIALAAMLLGFGPGLAAAGDFSNPVPYGHGSSNAAATAARMELERTRRNLIDQQSMEYYINNQDAANWVNAFMSGNTIILNGDNNVVTLTAENNTVDQLSENNCLSSSNTILNGSKRYKAGAQGCGD